MKNFKKSGVALLMVLVLVLSPMKVFAAELPTEAVYDLEKGGTQTFLVQDENGEIGEVTIEEVAGNARVSNGDYRVAYENPLVWTAGFYVSISNNQIYNAYSPFHHCLVGEIRYPALTRPSITEASYAFIFERSNINYATGVNAKIVNGEMIVSKK